MQASESSSGCGTEIRDEGSLCAGEGGSLRNRTAEPEREKEGERGGESRSSCTRTCAAAGAVLRLPTSLPELPRGAGLYLLLPVIEASGALAELRSAPQTGRGKTFDLELVKKSWCCTSTV